MIDEIGVFRRKVLRFPVFDSGGVLLLQADSIVTERLEDLLRKRKIWIQVYATVVVNLDNGRDQEMKVGDGPLYIGRGVDCQLRPVSELVSKKHCVLNKRLYSVTVTDLESSNGTFVNGKRIGGTVELADGDVLTLGGGAHMTVRIFAALRGDYGSLAAGLVLGSEPAEHFGAATTVKADPRLRDLMLKSGLLTKGPEEDG